MKNKNKKGFTLVELIMVVTILAILASIAFINFQYYTDDARDAKRKSNINDIVKSIELKLTQWVGLLNFVTWSWSRLSTWSIAWTGITSLSWTGYEAWDVNLTILGLVDKFKDDTNSYKIWVTTKAWGQYEVAWKMESDSTAFVKGTFIPRKASENWVWYFKVWDTLTWWLTVIKVSPDLETLTVKSSTGNITTISASSTWAYLNANDVLWLIGDKDDKTKSVTNGWTNLPY